MIVIQTNLFINFLNFVLTNKLLFYIVFKQVLPPTVNKHQTHNHRYLSNPGNHHPSTCTNYHLNAFHTPHRQQLKLVSFGIHLKNSINSKH